MTERTKVRLLVASTLGLAAVIMLGLPALFLTLPNPVARPVASLEAAGSGVYVGGDGKTWRLFPRATPLAEIPADAPILGRPAEVLVAVRQPGELAAYRVTALGGAQLKVRPRLRRQGKLEVVAIDVSALGKGSYQLEMPRESIYGGSDFAYFRVSR
jgi:hypothetical protein